jgi:hypothetical protein
MLNFIKHRTRLSTPLKRILDKFAMYEDPPVRNTAYTMQ